MTYTLCVFQRLWLEAVHCMKPLPHTNSTIARPGLHHSASRESGMQSVSTSYSNGLSPVENLLLVIFAVIAPIVASIKAFIAAKNRFTRYRYHHAQMLVDHTTSTNSGARQRTPGCCNSSVQCSAVSVRTIGPAAQHLYFHISCCWMHDVASVFGVSCTTHTLCLPTCLGSCRAMV